MSEKSDETKADADLASDAVEQIWAVYGEVQDWINAIPKFRKSLRLLLQHFKRDSRPRIKVTALTGPPSANAAAKRRSVRCLGHHVQVHQDLYHLMYDAVQAVIAMSAVVSKTGVVIVEPELSPIEVAGELKVAVRHYLEHDGQWTSSLRLHLARRIRGRRELSLPPTRRKDRLASCYLLGMVSFAMAHEISHIFLGHCDRPLPTDLDARWQEELEADAGGARLLIEHLARTDLAGLGDQAINVRVDGTIGCLCGIAILLSLNELIEVAAKHLSKSWPQTHPPARMRFEVIRDACLVLGIPPEAFSHPVAGIEPPDIIHKRIRELSTTISWDR